jgi:hypothetical protein
VLAAGGPPSGLLCAGLPLHLYAERGSPKFEKAAMRWLRRYLSEGTPRLRHFAEVAVSLAKREPDADGPLATSLDAVVLVAGGLR